MLHEMPTETWSHDFHSFSISGSRRLSRLASYYALAPSAILMRTAEAEILSNLPLQSPALDLCCGDGLFASLVRPAGFEVGCDLSEAALKQASRSGIYGVLACSDITHGIPFPNGYFNTIVSNSALEHVRDISAALVEVARVLKPSGKMYATFCSNYAYEWWPCGQRAKEWYLAFQPVYNYFSLEEWQRQMETAGLRIIGHQYYLSKAATRFAMFLDYHFSHVYMTGDKTLARPIIQAICRVPRKTWAVLWRKLFAEVRIVARGSGGGILIVVERED